MENLYALRERHASLAKELRALVENKDAQWNDESQARYDQGLAELDDLKAQIDRIHALNQRIADDALAGQVSDAAGRRGGDAAASTAHQLFAKWLRGGDQALSAAEWQQIRNTMSTTTGSEGGHTVQTEVAEEIINALKAYGGMREVATVITTEMGNPMSFPTSDGTSETGELIAENTTATAADPSFGTVSVNAYKFSSKIVAVPFELLQDSQVDIEAFVRGRLVERIGRITNTLFTTGTGTSQPRGVVTGSAAGKTGASGQTGTVIFDDLIDLIHAVDPAYRRAGTCRFMMNDATLAAIRKLKDDQSRPVFIPGYDGLGGPMPDTVLGYGVTINQDVATMAASAKSILFGDFAKYVIRDVMQATLFRFTDSAYAKLGQVGFLMWSRSGGNLVDTAAVKHYANAAT